MARALPSALFDNETDLYFDLEHLEAHLIHLQNLQENARRFDNVDDNVHLNQFEANEDWEGFWDAVEKKAPVYYEKSIDVWVMQEQIEELQKQLKKLMSG